MELIIYRMLAIVIAGGHLPFLLHFLSHARRGLIPPVVDFAALGVILYYDLGFLLQAFGWGYQSPYFPSMETLPIEQIVSLGLLILAAPYLLALGYRLSSGGTPALASGPVVAFSPRMRPIFFLLFIPVCIALALVGMNVIYGATSVADVKMVWMGILGSGYIVFLLPMFLLAFYLRTSDALSRWGLVFLGFLLATNVVATLFLGQRTMTLLPFLMVVLFRGRIRWARVAFTIVLLFTVASAALWFYKGFAVGRNDDLATRAQVVINNDFIRATVLARSLQESEPMGTRVLPAPGQGYLFTLLLYTPRSLFPQKGHSTASYFTSFANGEAAEFLSWGLGIGFLEEISLNFGYLMLIPGIVAYGVLLGLLQRLSHAFPACAVGTHLTPVWMSGYGSPSVLLYFGSMTLLAILLELCFTQRLKAAQPGRASATPGRASAKAPRERSLESSVDSLPQPSPSWR